MGIQVNFYKHTKRINSTALPSWSAGDFGTLVELKDAVNLFSPTLVLSTDVFSSDGEKLKNPMEYTYCYIPDFKRYYFVQSWSWILGRWECSLEVDVLASFKTEIGNTTAYVTRSASDCDPVVIDKKYVAKGEIRHYQSTQGNSPWSINIKTAGINSGFYVVGIANNDVNAIGAVAYYGVSVTAMRDFMNIMYSAPSWLNITDASLSTDLQKMMLNPLQYVVSCIWIPTGLNTSGLYGMQTIPYGWWTLSLTNSVFYRLDSANMAKVLTFYFNVQDHPQAGSNRKWLNFSPYTQISLEFSPFGMIPIDTVRLANSDGICCSVWVDYITGKSTLYIYRAVVENRSWVAKELIYETVSQLGIPIALAQMSVDMSNIGSASTLVGAAGLAATNDGMITKVKNGASGMLGRLLSSSLAENFASHIGASSQLSRLQGAFPATPRASGSFLDRADRLLDSAAQYITDVGNAAMVVLGQCSSSGATGAFAMLQYPPSLNLYYQMIVDTDDEHNGMPLCKMVKINTLRGFVLCSNADGFAANCMPAERQAVISLMESGFYYE